MNKLKPGSVPKIHTSGGPMRLRENVGFFQNAARAYGVNESEVFQAVDCFDKQNIQQVTVRLILHLSSRSIRLCFSPSELPICTKSCSSKKQVQRSQIRLSNQITNICLNSLPA